MNKAEKSILRGLDETLASAKGDKTGARVHRIAVKTPDVVAIRKKSGLSQTQFARSIDVPLGTLQGWEQGRRRPVGPARVLQALIEKRPSIVRDELGAR
jgi:putative transcriptional regulator